MKIYQKLSVYLTIALLLSQPVCAGLEEHRLLVGSGVRQIGMGCASTAAAVDSWSMLWNPSTLRQIDQIEFSLFDSPLQPDSIDREGGLAMAIGAKTIGISQKDFGMLGVASWFDGWGDDSEKNRIIDLGYGFPISHDFSAGMAIRHHRQSDQYSTKFDWSFDVGMLYSHKLNRLGDRFSVGLAINEIQIKREENLEQIPIASRVGIAYQPDDDTIFSCDFEYRNDRALSRQNRFRGYVGAERWLFGKIVGIRTGYMTTANYNTLADGEWTRGISLQSKFGEISYAYVTSTKPLDQGGLIDPGIHLISATLKWGKTAEEPDEITEEIFPEPILMPSEVKETVCIPYEMFSPNDDGKNDGIPIELNIDDSQSWTFELKDGYDENIRTFTGTGTPIEPLVWDGKDPDGNPVREGTYISQLIVSDDMPVFRNTIIVDTTPPDLSISTEPLLMMSQAQHGYTRELVLNIPKIHISTSDKNGIAKWAIEISDDSGNVLQEFNGKDKPADMIIWDNWEEKIVIEDEPQQFDCKMTVEDIAGNESVANATLSSVDISKVSGRRDERGIVVSLPSVTFDTNKHEVKHESHDVLKEVAEVIKAYPKAKVQIEGHTDDVGDNSYNLELSKKRADTVLTYLVKNFGIEAKRLTAIGYGETQPIASNHTTEGRQKNRRVDIVLLSDDTRKVVKRENEETRKREDEKTGRRENKKTRKRENGKMSEYDIQIGAYRQKINAETVVKIVEKTQLDHRIWISEALIRGSIWYKVMLGEFPDRVSAQKVADRLKEELGWEVVIIQSRRDEMSIVPHSSP